MSNQGKAEQVGTDEGNRMIAEFEGWQSNKYPNLPNKMHKMEEGQEVGVYLRHLPYHSDWSLLMPVVENINKNGKFRVRILFDANGTNAIYNCFIDSVEWRNSHLEEDRVCGNSGIESAIEIVWKTLVDFIKWHKQQSLTP